MSKKTTVLYILAGFALFLVIVVRNTPAVFALGYASQATRLFTAYNTTGTLWDGESRIIIQQGQYNIDLGAVKWSVSGWALLVGQLRVNLDTRAPEQSLSGDFSLGLIGRTLQAEGLQASFDLALVKQFVPAPGQVAGLADINLPLLEVDLNTLQLTELEGNVVIKDLIVNFAGEVELGTYGARLSLADNPNGEERIVIADINDIDAQVGVKGVADVLPFSQDYYLDVHLSPKESANTMIINTLRQLYKAQADGSYNVRFGDPLRQS